MGDLAFESATSLARRIGGREVSSLEVVEACLARIEAVNPALNAVVCLTADAALAGARNADAALARGEVRGPLHGVPITIKDALETAGVVTTSGTRGRAGHVPSQDATVVARLKAAGAILLGKTNLPELAHSFESDNLVYGRCNNPYDLARTPGGSSGGEAAIIAAGGSPLGLGSDAGGSIRVPAHFCGVAGLKPTSGRVPSTGHYPAAFGATAPLWQVGPLARRVEDLALALGIIAGPDGRDPYAVPAPLGDPTAVDLERLQVAFFTDNGVMAPTAETADTVRRCAALLAHRGLAIEEDRPAELPQSYDLHMELLAGAVAGRLIALVGEEEVDPSLRRLAALLEARALRGAELNATLVRLDEYRSAMLRFWDRYDALVCPANAQPAMPHGSTWDDDRFPGFSYTWAFNSTGWPAVVVRAGTSPEGLPIGVQVVARPWREDVALALAQQIEAGHGGWQPPAL